MEGEDQHTRGGGDSGSGVATPTSKSAASPVAMSSGKTAQSPGAAATTAYRTPPSEEEDGSTGPSQQQQQQQPVAAAPFLLRRRRSRDPYADDDDDDDDQVSGASTPEIFSAEAVLPDAAPGRRTYIVAADDAELRRLLKRGLERESSGDGKVPPKRTTRAMPMQHAHDMKAFARQFSAFDRQNELSAASAFHGFYVLFWMAVAVLIVKAGADNWRQAGSPFGTNELMRYMFARDVIVLLFSDGVMCGITGVSWALQRLVLRGYIDWNRSGWILQNIWQSLFIAGVVGLTLVRDWPWTHTVYFVLHGLVMLMKQHSYAFTNGHLSTVYRERQRLLAELKELEAVEPADAPKADGDDDDNEPLHSTSTAHFARRRRPSASEYYTRQQRRLSTTSEQQQQQPPRDGGSPEISDDVRRIDEAVASGRPLTAAQLALFARLLRTEADALGAELRGQAARDAPEHWYPRNATFANFYEYVVLPTLVYELQYPRAARVDWWYVAEKAAAMVGVIFVMTMVSQTWIYPVVVRTLYWKEELGWDTARRFQEFPWLLSDLIFPFMIEYLLAWYLIWETILNILAELTYFADRSFYDAWWNSVSWDQFARDWNRPVHNFLLRHVYHSSLSAMRVRRETATLMTFFLSACVHELVMWCIFKKLRGYLLALQMCQLPLVRLSRTRWLRHRPTLGNMIFWVGILTGPSLLCSLYLVL